MQPRRGDRRAIDNYGMLQPRVSELVAAESIGELKRWVQRARWASTRLTLRGAGCSFHDQAQGDHVTLRPTLPPRCRVEGDDVVATASVTWGQLFDRTLAAGRLPMVAPTSAAISLGGAASSDSINRFSTTLGKEHEQIAAVTLLDGTGQLRRLTTKGTSDAERDLFRAVVGGYGGLGVIVELTYRFPTSPFTGPPRTATEPKVCRDDEMIEHLVRHHREAPRGEGAWAVSDRDGRAVFLRQRLVDPDTPSSPLILHRPDDLRHRLGVLLTCSSRASQLMHRASVKWMARRERPFVDDWRGQQFMMDGNRSVRLAAKKRGLPLPLLQQSFALPIADPGAAGRFLEVMRRTFHDRGVVPAVIDSLVVPADDHPLSSTRGMAGVVISPAVQLLHARGASNTEGVFRLLSRACADLGGRVHLTKHVFAEPDVLDHMYGEGMTRFRRARAILDPEGIFGSPFLDRLEGATATGPVAIRPAASCRALRAGRPEASGGGFGGLTGSFA